MHLRNPYIWSRSLGQDLVLVAMDMEKGEKRVPTFGVLPEGAEVIDAYSGVTARVRNATVALTTPWRLVLLSEHR